MRVSEIRVKWIRVNQALEVFIVLGIYDFSSTVNDVVGNYIN